MMVTIDGFSLSFPLPPFFLLKCTSKQVPGWASCHTSPLLTNGEPGRNLTLQLSAVNDTNKLALEIFFFSLFFLLTSRHSYVLPLLNHLSLGQSFDPSPPPPTTTDCLFEDNSALP